MFAAFFANKLVGPIAMGAAFGLALLCTYLFINNSFLSSQVDELTNSINNPKTGYVAMVATAHLNVATCQTALNQQNSTISLQAQDDAQRLKQAASDVALANIKIDVASRQLGTFMNRPVMGNDACAREDYVHKQILLEAQR
jgi:hypothetical protein